MALAIQGGVATVFPTWQRVSHTSGAKHHTLVLQSPCDSGFRHHPPILQIKSKPQRVNVKFLVEISLCSYTLYLPQCDVGKDLVSFYSSNKQGTFQVDDSAVCMFCHPHLVKLNICLKNCYFWCVLDWRWHTRPYNRCPHFPL